MRMLSMLFAVVTVVTGAGCATTTATVSGKIQTGNPEDEVIPAFAPPDEEDENAALRRMLAKATIERHEAAELAGDEPIAIDLDPVVYPPAIAKTAKAADGCESGPGGLEIRNATDLHLQLAVDGDEVMILGPKNVQLALAPKRSIFLCLDPSRPHIVTGTAYAAKAGKLYEAECFKTVLEKTDKKDGNLLVVNYRTLAGD